MDITLNHYGYHNVIIKQRIVQLNMISFGFVEWKTRTLIVGFSLLFIYFLLYNNTSTLETVRLN